MNKLAISNIAWHNFENKKIYELMTKLGIKGLEIAPSRLFSDPYNTSQQNIFAAKQAIEDLGLRIVSLQSLLYKHDELKLFADTETRKYLKLHLKKAISLAAALSADVLIFGSPGNRIKGEMQDHRAEEISIDFFRDIGNYAREHNVCFLLEATPKQYGADFIVNTSEAISLVKKVNNANFQLNLDLGTLISNNANFASILEMALPITRHIHISEPFLAHVPQSPNLHNNFANALSKHNYQHYISIEMRSTSTTNNFDAIKDTLEFLINTYGN